MTTDNIRFAARVDNLRGSDIREILKVTQRPALVDRAPAGVASNRDSPQRSGD
jgi:hypothetical protein